MLANFRQSTLKGPRPACCSLASLYKSLIYLALLYSGRGMKNRIKNNWKQAFIKFAAVFFFAFLFSSFTLEKTLAF